MVRPCAKLRCRSRASATVTLRYEDREVVVGELAPEPDPTLVDLCGEHADRLTPPLGWRITDTRSPVPAAI